MTTKVIVSCPDTSHWDARVTVEDQVFSFETQKMTDEWREAQVVVLKPTESFETYLTSSRRVSIVEVDRSPS